MPASLLSTCSSEDERLYLETITHFLAKADTQALHTALNSLQITVSALETRLTTLQNAHTKLVTTNEAIQTNNQALQARLESCLALNDALRAKHDDLQRNVEATARANAEMRIATEDSRGSVEALRSRLMGMVQQQRDRDREQQQGTDNATVLELQSQMTQVEIRLEDVEGVVEHVARLVGRGPPVSGIQERATETWNRSNTFAGPVERPGGSRDIEYGEQPSAARPDRIPARNKHDALHSHELMPQKQQSQLHHKQSVHVSPSAQGSSNSSSNTAYTDRFESIKRHFLLKKQEFKESRPRDQRRFIWSFIDGCNDTGFSLWFQRELLEKLPAEMAHPAASRPSRGRILALTSKVTWDAVRGVLKVATLPDSFFE